VRVRVDIPGVRLVACWNCVIHVVRRGDALDDVQGWLTDAQADRLRAAAERVPAGGRIVEIGSYHGRSTIVLARATGAEVVAIDPHAGNDRGPQQWTGTSAEGEADNRTFHANLARAGVAGRVRHVRQPSQDALEAVSGAVDVLYVDGAHRYAPAAADITRWGARVAPGGTLLVHDAFSSVGVTLAILRHLLVSREFRYVGRSGSLAEYRREDGLHPAGALRQLTSLLWFARNLVIKGLIVARLRSGPWPY
jgi:predicted O-methyltransferase YrrM